MRNITLIVLLMLGVAGTLHAQNDDEIIGGSPDIVFTPRQTSLSESGDGNNCSSVFLEGVVFFGGSRTTSKVDAGAGFSLAYVPGHWGGYGTLTFPDRGLMGSFGLVLRPFANPRFMDWQLFAGPALFKGVGVEYGMRFSSTRKQNGGAFSWMSASFSYIYLPEWSFFTVGLSIDLFGFWGLFVI